MLFITTQCCFAASVDEITTVCQSLAVIPIAIHAYIHEMYMNMMLSVYYRRSPTAEHVFCSSPVGQLLQKLSYFIVSIAIFPDGTDSQLAYALESLSG